MNASSKILIVEDEVLVAEEMAGLLAEWGHEVVGTVASGEYAVEKAQEIRPDLVLMDVNLAGEMDGIEAARLIRSCVDTAIVYITGNPGRQVFDRARVTEPDGYLSKPFSADQLGQSVEMALFKRHAEGRVKESEARYRALFYNAAFGMDLVDRHGRFVEVNPAFCRMLGYRADELKQLTIDEVTHPEDAEISRKSLHALVTGDIDSYRIEKRYICKNGGIVWADLSVSAIRDENGRHVATIGAIADITQRKRAEQALRASEELHRALFDAADDAIFLMEAERERAGTIVSANRAMADMHGYDVDDLPGRRRSKGEDLCTRRHGCSSNPR